MEEDTEEKIALTQEQEDSLLSFAAGNPVYWKYRDEIIIFLGTGLRVSEFCGLTVNLDLSTGRSMWIISFSGIARLVTHTQHTLLQMLKWISSQLSSKAQFYYLFTIVDCKMRLGNAELCRQSGEGWCK